MPRGDKSKYTDKQKRKAEHIEEGYLQHGASKKEAASRAWATVNAESHGGEKPGGSGYGKPENHESSSRGGRISLSGRTHAERSAAAKKAAATRKRKAVKRPAAAARRATAKKGPAKKSPAKKRTTRKSPARRT